MSTRLFRLSVSLKIVLLFLAIAALCPPASWAGNGFQPVNPDELKMTSEPLAPGATAIILYRQVDRDDNSRTSHEDNYYRVKILTEEGRKYADVEIRFIKGNDDVVGVRARTIRPDGSIQDFNGKVFEKVIVKSRGLKYVAKTFTLPDVQVGCIIEYYYTYSLKDKSLFDSHWILTDDLFTRDAKFSLKPYVNTYPNHFNLRWSWQGLTNEALPVQGPDHIIRLEAKNIPAFQPEDFMPPENEVKARVDFIYSDDLAANTSEEFWKQVGKRWNGFMESFVGKPKAMEAVVSQIISPSDPPEVKLQKIYDRVQQIRNTSYQIEKTQQEQKRDKEKALANVEEVWKRGYGSYVQLNWLYLALVRAAGFEAYGCWVSNRREYFFTPVTMESHKLDDSVVLVKLNGKDLYLAPGIKFAPFGLLPWVETGTRGLRLDSNGGTWIKTTLPQSTESQIRRTAKLTLSDTGDLEGKLTVAYTGLEAMYRRLEERNADEVERKKLLEEQVNEQIPAVAELALTNKPDWDGTETPLTAEFDLKIPAWASNAGKRTLLPAGFFVAHEKHIFEHTNRVHPIYFEYPYQKVDDVTISLPPGWQLGSAPPPQIQDSHIIRYDLTVEGGKDKDTVHIVRKLNFDILLLEPKYYTALRDFFQAVRTGDDEQILLQPGTASASN